MTPTKALHQLSGSYTEKEFQTLMRPSDLRTAQPKAPKRSAETAFGNGKKNVAIHQSNEAVLKKAKKDFSQLSAKNTEYKKNLAQFAHITVSLLEKLVPEEQRNATFTNNLNTYRDKVLTLIRKKDITEQANQDLKAAICYSADKCKQLVPNIEEV